MKRISKYLAGILLMTVTAVPATAQSSEGEGDSGSKVILTEYSDYQCPACASYHPLVKKLKQDYGDKLKVNYRHFPLNSHQYAALAARAAEAAKNQGKFIEMHNMLFENQQNWASSGNPQAIFIGYARELDLDIDAFREDLNSAETQKTVMEEKKRGIERGVNATPTFFINGEELRQMPRSYDSFKAIIESYMQETN